MSNLKLLRWAISHLSAMLFMGSGLLYAGTVPDIRGLWIEGPSEGYHKNCLHSKENGAFKHSGGKTFTVLNQTGGSFSFTRVQTELVKGNTIESTEENLGIVIADGTFSGTGYYFVTINGIFQYSGMLTFSGSMDGNFMTLQKNFQDLVAHTCQSMVMGTSTRRGIVPPSLVMDSHDIDDNGTADLVWRNTITGSVAIWFMDGKRIAASEFFNGISLAWEIAQVGDVNGDGKADLIWRNSSSGMVSVWLMNGKKIISMELLYSNSPPTNWEIQQIGDVDGDGKEDLIWQNKTSGLVAIWLMNGAKIASVGYPGSVPSEWRIKQMGDVNGDSLADLIWQNEGSGTVAVWLMNGVTINSVGFPGSASSDWKMKGIGDVDGNGKSDLIWQRTGSGVVAFWLMNGSEIVSAGFSDRVPSDWKIQQVNDVNGDGKADVIWQNTNSGTVAVWLMDGITISSVGFTGSPPTNWKIQN